MQAAMGTIDAKVPLALRMSLVFPYADGVEFVAHFTRGAPSIESATIDEDTVESLMRDDA